MSLSETTSLAELIKNTPTAKLPDMPLITDPDATTVSIVDKNPKALLSILSAGAENAHPLFLKALDIYYARKIKKGKIPFGDEILGVAQVANGTPGPIAMNFSYDLACSTGIYLTDEGHPSLIRTLDWKLKMAAATIALTRKGRGGDWIDITYPGYAATVTAIGQHFTAAVNRSPLPQRFNNLKDATLANYKPPFTDKIVSFLQTLVSDDISPVHLLRQTFEECVTFDEAVQNIAQTKTNCSVIISIAGTKPNEAAIIYKDRNYCAISTFPEGFDRLSALFEENADVKVFEEEHLAATNHWPKERDLPPTHQRQNTNSGGRKARIIEALPYARKCDVFELLKLSKTETDGENIVPRTVLAAELTAATGMVRAVAMQDLVLVQKPAEFYLS